MANYRKSKNRSTKYYHSLIYFNKNLASWEKSKVTDGSSNQKRAYKSDGIIFLKCITSLSFHGITMIYDVTEENVSSSPGSVLKDFLDSAS
jgi:hypothetical protein